MILSSSARTSSEWHWRAVTLCSAARRPLSFHLDIDFEQVYHIVCFQYFPARYERT